MVRLGLLPLSILCLMGPSLLPPPKTFELCPNVSILLIAPALVSGCILGLHSGGEALSVAEAGVVPVSGLGSLCPDGSWAQLPCDLDPRWLCGSWRRKRS